MTTALTEWACRVLLSADPYGPAIVGIGTTRDRAERAAERLLAGRQGYARSVHQCSPVREVLR